MKAASSIETSGTNHTKTQNVNPEGGVLSGIRPVFEKLTDLCLEVLGEVRMASEQVEIERKKLRHITAELNCLYFVQTFFFANKW